MKLLRHFILLLVFMLSIVSVASARAGDTYVVNSTADSGPGSLTQAILLANSKAGPHAILFQIPGDGPHIIQPRTALPTITQPVLIDGTSQPGYAGYPVVELNGAATGGADGLRLAGGASTVRGLVINAFAGYGVVLSSAQNIVEGNFIGINALGVAATANTKGGVLISGAGNRVGGPTSSGRNIISGNGGPGITVTGAGATDNLIQGNYIGANVDGTSAIANNGHGISIASANNTVGGIVPGTRNVITGNRGSGVYIAGGAASDNQVVGNHIGTNAAGTAVLGNGGHGVYVFGPRNTIGGVAPGARNVISGNALRGVYLAGSASRANVIQGNYIGTNAAGTAALGNGENGIVIQDGPGNTIGGTSSSARNVIAGNGGTGLYITGNGATGNIAQGNYIGTNAAGRAALGNGDAGILIQDAPANIIGGTVAGARNIISGNAGAGVYLSGGGAMRNLIQDNFIGTNAAGSAALGNDNSGIAIQDAPNNTIGGASIGAGNLISGNTQQGIFITGSGALANLVQGNRIGANSAGNAILSNGDNGVLIQDAPGNLVGGAVPAAANIISGNSQNGIFITGNSATGNLVQGNSIGANAAGIGALANGGHGVAIQDAPNNLIGGTTAGTGNLISGNTQAGIYLTGNWATGNIIQGNRIGTNAVALASLANGQSGVVAQDAANNIVGGASAEARNIISGNTQHGIYLVGEGTRGNSIQGNFIGTRLDGAAGLPNGEHGALLHDASSNTIGGALPGVGNVLSGNALYGVSTLGSASENTIQGNLIGLDSTGNTAVGNGHGGIHIASQKTFVGGTTFNARNVISGNRGPGITLSTGATGALIRGNAIGLNAAGTGNLGNESHGIYIINTSDNMIGGSGAGAANIIAYSVGAGVRIDGASSVNNGVLGNLIYGNTGLAISLAGRIIPNDAGDLDSGPNHLQNSPVVITAIPTVNGTLVSGRLDGAPFTPYRVEFFAGNSCQSAYYGQAQVFLGSTNVTTNQAGAAVYTANVSSDLSIGRTVTATATDPANNSSPLSTCTVVSGSNDSWPRAKFIPLSPSSGDPQITEAIISDYVYTSGQARWYKFTVQPGSRLSISLKRPPANYDLVLYRDIAAAYRSLTSPQDLVLLGAEFDDVALLPDSAAPFVAGSTGYAPDSYAPDSYAPDSFAGYAYAPDSYAPDSYAPDSYAPDSFAPDSFAPDSYAPDSFAPDNETFSSAQLRSIMAVSAMNGRADELITARTWDNSGDFYIRVRGRDGEFSPDKAFTLQIKQTAGVCGDISPIQTPSSLTPVAGTYKTIILVDMSRLPGTEEQKAALGVKLNVFAARPEVAGVVVDVGQDLRVRAANVQADRHLDCPTAKNYVALSIKDIVDRYRAPSGADNQPLNPLEYIVLVGSDNVIPFFRHPDQSRLANETNFVPPVLDRSASQASLRLGYVLSQDRYGEATAVTIGSAPFPVPQLAIGRLTETTTEMTAMLDAYLTTEYGITPLNHPALVTGYDFLQDAALAVKNELEAGTGLAADSLIQPRGDSPKDPSAWSAEDLQEELLGSRHDLIFLAGHFSAGSALAADYRTRLTAGAVAAAQVDLRNALIFSAGCHSGYNTVNMDAVPGLTIEPDWPSAFAQKGANLIAGTGYQYGDTDVKEYGERLYTEFARQLRTGLGPVAIGKALVAAKKTYLASTPKMKPLHAKSVLQATLYGFPMLSVNMPGARLSVTSDTSIVATTLPVDTNPGLTLGLASTDVVITPTLTTNAVPFKDVSTGQVITTTYLAGLNGIFVNPGDLVLPLETRNVTVPGTVLRGVGFRGGVSTEQSNVLPLTSAVATELSPIRAPFRSDVFYPAAPWTINYFDALDSGGATRLVVTPAQFRSSQAASIDGVLRRFNAMNFRLFYSKNVSSYGGNIPALAAPPAISRVAALTANQTVTFTVSVAGSPAAGVQSVWVTYVNLASATQQWQSLDLDQDPRSTTVWQGALPLGAVDASNVRYMVQAVNGVGLVTLATNLGALYTPMPDLQAGRDADSPLPPLPDTRVIIESPPTVGSYGGQITLSAVLSSQGVGLANQLLSFSVGAQRRDALTDNNGRARVTLRLLDRPGASDIRVAYAGAADYAASATATPMTILKQSIRLFMTPTPAASANEATGMIATLTDSSGSPLSQKTILLLMKGNTRLEYVTLTTDYAGRVTVDPLPTWVRLVTAYFAAGEVEVSAGVTINLTDEVYSSATTTFRPGRAAYEVYLPLVQFAAVPPPTATPAPPTPTLEPTTPTPALPTPALPPPTPTPEVAVPTPTATPG